MGSRLAELNRFFFHIYNGRYMCIQEVELDFPKMKFSHFGNSDSLQRECVDVARAHAGC